MITPYVIKLYQYTPEEQRAAEIGRIDSLFTEIESRYWAWKKEKREKGIKEFTSRQIMSKEDAEAFFDGQQESDRKALIHIFETLNTHYVRLYHHVQQFNNVSLRKAIAEDKRQYKEFCSGLPNATEIGFKYKAGDLVSITVWYGIKHKRTLDGINGYILKDIYERLKQHPIFPCSSITPEEEGFDAVRTIILEEATKHIFEQRYNPKSDLQPLAERCCDLYSDIMKHKEWIFKGDKYRSDSWHAGKKIVKLLGLTFDMYNTEDTFINALHRIRELKNHSLSDIISVELEEA